MEKTQRKREKKTKNQKFLVRINGTEKITETIMCQVRKQSPKKCIAIKRWETEPGKVEKNSKPNRKNLCIKSIAF